MRTLVIVGLVVGPVLVFGVPLALASGVTAPPPWTAASAPLAFGLAGAAALGGVVLLALSFRGRRATLPDAAPASLPAASHDPVRPDPVPEVLERPAVIVPTVVPRRSGPRYIATETTTSPVGSARSRYVTLRTRRTTVPMRERTAVRAG